MADNIDTLKKELEAARNRILELEMRLKNAELLYVAELKKSEVQTVNATRNVFEGARP